MHFERVSDERFKIDMGIKNFIHNDTPLPQRATSGSAGYDFFTPEGFTLHRGETICIPTGIRAFMEEGWVLLIFPRSGMGFKYRLQLDNTVGVIDSDYYYSDNEGHIFIKMTMDALSDKTLTVKKGEAFAQGVFIRYGLVDGDNAAGRRNGGLGSTSKIIDK